jgi:hypothetical protein
MSTTGFDRAKGAISSVQVIERVGLPSTTEDKILRLAVIKRHRSRSCHKLQESQLLGRRFQSAQY